MSNVREIIETDFEAISTFLQENHHPRLPASTWMNTFGQSWQWRLPPYGFILEDGIIIVGTILTFVAKRNLCNRTVTVCNLSTWCVLSDYRSESLSLLFRATSDKGIIYTDLSPTIQVAEILRTLRFKQLSSRATVLKISLKAIFASLLHPVAKHLTDDELNTQQELRENAYNTNLLFLKVQVAQQELILILRPERLRQFRPKAFEIIYTNNSELLAAYATTVSSALIRLLGFHILRIDEFVCKISSHNSLKHNVRLSFVKNLPSGISLNDKLYSEFIILPI